MKKIYVPVVTVYNINHSHKHYIQTYVRHSDLPQFSLVYITLENGIQKRKYTGDKNEGFIISYEKQEQTENQFLYPSTPFIHGLKDIRRTYLCLLNINFLTIFHSYIPIFAVVGSYLRMFSNT